MYRNTEKRANLLVQTLNAVRLLRLGRYQIDELAQELGMKRRATERMLRAIQVAGIEVRRQQEGCWVYWSIDRAQVMDAFGLNANLKTVRPVRRTPAPVNTKRATAYDDLEAWRKSEGL